MAGLYPDVPGNRLAWDTDGSKAVRLSGDGLSVVSVMSSNNLIALNNESDDSVDYVIPARSSGQAAVIFPMLINLQGVYAACSSPSSAVHTFRYSADTTTGADGTWTAFTSSPTFNSQSVPSTYRTGISTQVQNGIKAIKYVIEAYGGWDANHSALHLYGTPVSNAYDHLEIWNASGTARVTGAFFDFGNLQRELTSTKQFRIKNLSSTKTANTISVAASALTDPAPTFVSATTFSTDNITYSSSLNIGNLSPGSLSGVLYIKVAPISTQTLGLATERISAIATSWT